MIAHVFIDAVIKLERHFYNSEWMNIALQQSGFLIKKLKQKQIAFMHLSEEFKNKNETFPENILSRDSSSFYFFTFYYQKTCVKR